MKVSRFCMRLSRYAGGMPDPTRFTAELLPDELGGGSFPEVRMAMMEFVGRFLVDFEQAALREGLSAAQARVLGFAAARPSSMREIATQFGCDPSNITAKAQRLLELGLVDRSPSPDDARVALISATAAGAETARRLCSGREWLAGTLERLDDAEIATVHAALELLTAVESSPARA